MSYYLEIELCSPLTSSSGSGWANQVDTDICLDEAGLPVLPGRRLKGLLHDGLRNVIDAFTQCEPDVTDSSASLDKRLFGQVGAGINGQSLIRIQDGMLQGLGHEGETHDRRITELVSAGAISRQEVTGALTTVQAQTALEPRTGAARENTLRFSRAADRGLIFHAPVEILEDQSVPLFGLAAAAVQEMGLARSRGKGKVRVCLKDARGTDYTKNALEQVEEKGFRQIVLRAETEHDRNLTDLETIPAAGTADTDKSKQEKFLLRYRVSLVSQAVLPEAGGDANTINSSSYIPGSTMLGCFARQYLDKNGGQSAVETAEFQRLFLKGTVSFLNGYPESRENSQCRLIPAPHSIRRKKGAGSIYDLVEKNTFLPPLQRITGSYVSFADPMKQQEVEMAFHYHHAQAKDRRYGRALGDDVSDGGALFTVEALESGQNFIGAVVGAENDLKILRQIITDNSFIAIGKSKSAQYGKSRFSWLDVEEPRQYSGDEPEWNSWQPSPVQTANDNNLLTITCLSPLLSVNEWGQPAPYFPVEELADLLNIPGKLTLSGSWVRVKKVGGFHVHLQLPARQWPAIDAGSVFQFQLADDLTVAPEQLRKLETAALGLNCQAGFGRLAVNLHGPGGVRAISEYVNRKIKPMQPAGNLAKIILDPQQDKAVISLLATILYQRAETSLEQQAAQNAATAENLPAASTLSRVALLLRREDWQAKALAEINNFKEPAKKSLAACRIKNSTGQKANLLKLTKNNLDNVETCGKKTLADETQTGGDYSLNQFITETSLGILQNADDSAPARLTRSYLLALYKQLTYHIRQKAKEKA